MSDYPTLMNYTRSPRYSAYNLNFTNTTVKASFTVADPTRNLTIYFDGKRRDGLNKTSSPEDKPGQYSAIALAPPENNTMPHFTFATGAEFQWHRDSELKWTASSSKGTRNYSHTVLARWISLVLGALLVSS
jgi:hypothetical protein